MVTNVKRQRIGTGEAPVQELQRRFSEELQGKMKEAALKIGCNVEELAYRVNNVGIVEIRRMTGDEILDAQAQDAEAKRIRDIKKSRGL